jgi:hypothetical protein
VADERATGASFPVDLVPDLRNLVRGHGRDLALPESTCSRKS